MQRTVRSEKRYYAIGALLIIAFCSYFFSMQLFLVEGASMAPTLHNGDRVFVDKLTYRLRRPQHGEIIVFRYPAEPQRKYIKRIIGLPGDFIEIKDWTVYVNGQPLIEDYIYGPTYDQFGPITVPQDAVFVLGDNRNESEDSRFPSVGFVLYEDIVGRARFTVHPLQRIQLLSIPDILR